MTNKRIIAFYLPQYHPIPENDEWWGTGFTEWTNVSRAKPLFNGHYQPRLPGDLGFYDLRLPEARQAQAELAKVHGIYGFCYYYYWFSGKKLLERPAEEMLKTGKPDFPFMLCWANENWTRRWDGSDDKILIKQNYNQADAANLFHSLHPFFKDKRYIRVDGKPVFAVYNLNLLPDAEKFVKIFRDEAGKNALSIYLLGVEGFNRTGRSFLNDGLDASIEFQPFGEALKQFKLKNLESQSVKHTVHRALGKIYKSLGLKARYDKMWAGYYHRIDYKRYVDFIIKNYKYPVEYKLYPGVAPFWDNSPRTGRRATIFLNESPEKYGEWLAFHHRNFVPFSEEENFIFINAWNEWGEGNHLEPCDRWGLKYLEETRKALLDEQSD